MLPLFWRYLLSHYFKVFFLTLISCVVLLLVSRLTEASKLTAFGSDLFFLFSFIGLQIPYILPFVIPIGALIGAVTLYQTLSNGYELTALRASGISLFHSLTPVLVASLFLSLANFYIASEVATACHHKARTMTAHLSSSNPIRVLQNVAVAKLKQAYIQMDVDRQGDSASNLYVALPTKEGLHLMIAKKMNTKEATLHTENVTLLSSGVDHLVIENHAMGSGNATELSSLLYKKKWRLANDHLTLNLLLAKLAQNRGEWKKCLLEIMRRVWCGVAPFTFTLLGALFSIQWKRTQTKGISSILVLASLSLISFFVAKEVMNTFWLSLSLFLIPQLLVLIFSFRQFRRVNEG